MRYSHSYSLANTFVQASRGMSATAAGVNFYFFITCCVECEEGSMHPGRVVCHSVRLSVRDRTSGCLFFFSGIECMGCGLLQSMIL